MTYSNYPSAESNQENPAPRKKDNRGLIYGLLIVALIATWGYVIWDKSQVKQKDEQQEAQIASLDSSKTAVQEEYNAALQRLDEMTSENSKLDSLLKKDDAEIKNMKNRIASLLKKERATQKDLAEARQLIADLNGKIDGYVVEIERLQGENKVLTAQRDTLTVQNQQLQTTLTTTETAKQEVEQRLDVASTLTASNINIKAINETSSGREKETSSAKRADKMRVTFDVFNRVGEEGEKELYVIVTSPDGSIINNAALGSGNFTTREDGDKVYTKKQTVNFSAGKVVPVSVEWKPEKDFTQGDYKIEIYNNGFKIGQAVKSLKKGGLFG